MIFKKTNDLVSSDVVAYEVNNALEKVENLLGIHILMANVKFVTDKKTEDILVRRWEID